jgi:hypothetical protein
MDFIENYDFGDVEELESSPRRVSPAEFDQSLNDFLQNFDFGEFSPRSSSTPLGEGSDAPPKNNKRQSDDDGDGNRKNRSAWTSPISTKMLEAC